MSTPPIITAVFHRTADGYLAAQVDDLAWLAVPVKEGWRLASAWRLTKPIEAWTPADFHGSDGLVGGEAAFRAHVETIAEHRRQLQALPRPERPMRVSTPWGAPQQSWVYAEGVVRHSTASHGGFHLDRRRNARVHRALSNKGGWYEEDCEWAKLAATFPDLFTDRERPSADRTLRNWYPDAWERIHGVVLQPGESRIKDERQFRLDHANDWVVVSAVTACHRPGFVDCVATLGGIHGAGERRRFLVPAEDYTTGRFGYVIDETWHEPYDGPADFGSAR
jgi:hypothetical protein